MEDKVVHRGFLLLPPQGKIVLKKSWQQKYCLLYKQSKFGIERLEIYDSSLDVPKHSTCRIITLENCVKITPVSANLFIVITKNTQYEFGTLTEESLNEWVTAIQSVAFKDDVSKITSIEEDNDLYCSSGEGVFQVTLWPSDASKRCNLEPNKIFTLILTSTAIQLRNSVDNKILYTWPYCYIRRYGYRSGKFTFEAGRKCDSGEGVFHLEHSNQQQIFRCLSSKMKSMKKILSGESTTSLLDCGDNQFQAALSMEARSRSPLPPSPTSSTRVHDIEINNSNQNSMHSILSFTDSVDKNRILLKSNENTNSNQNAMHSLLSFTDSVEKSVNDRRPLPKPRPAKPPRKNLPVCIKNIDKIGENTYDLVTADKNKYDEIEYRQAAWKTQGVSEIKHTESVDDLVDYVSWSRKEIIQNDLPTNKNTSKVITNPTPTDENYDRLQFFGSSSKLNIPGYKQVSPINIQAINTNPSWSDYDEVEVNMQAVRLADDSHLGYGMIRKVAQNKIDNSQVTHQVFNDNIYAIVSKPKQV